MARGGKWSWSDGEVHSIIGALNGKQSIRDRALIVAGVLWGFRISELLSLRVGDVVDSGGNLKAFITIENTRLKGGKEGKVENNGKGKARKRRAPDDRTVPMGLAASYIQAQLDTLSKTRGGLTGERYLFESRKRNGQGESRPISRQQAWLLLKKAMRLAGLDASKFGTHSLRKTFAQNLMEVSKRLDLVRDALGHRSSATTDRYLRSDNRERFAFMDVVGKRLFRQVA